MAYNLFAGYKAGAFILPLRVFKPRTPEKIVMIKVKVYIIPAAHAAVAVVDAVRGVKLAYRQCKAAYQYYGDMRAPGQPA